MKNKKPSSFNSDSAKTSRLFWHAFFNKARGVLAILLFGIFFVYLGLIQIIDAYYCIPSSKNDLEFIKGSLIGIDKSKRLGDTILVNTGDNIRSIRGIITGHEESLFHIGKPVTIGVVAGAVCTQLPEYIESNAQVVREFSISGRLKGRWITNLLSGICFVMAWLIISKSYLRLTLIYRETKTKDLRND